MADDSIGVGPNVTVGEPYVPPPYELVQAVAMACHPWDWGQMEAALSDVPDGWAKWEGRWVRVTQADRSDVEAGRTILVTESEMV